jgi:hypothetical protein
MKYLSALIMFQIVLLTQVSARADSFWEATGQYLQKYGVPCVAGMAAGYVIDHDKGVEIGAIGCVAVFTYGEFGRGSGRTITNDDVDIIQGMINKDSSKSAKGLRDDYNAQFERMNQKILDDSLANRQSIRNSVTDLGVFLERDLNDKVDKRMENPKLMEVVDQKINSKVKEEVQDEFRSKEREIVEKATERTIKRITVEPIIVDDQKPRPVATPAQ